MFCRLNKFNIQKLLVAIDVPCDAMLEQKYISIFATSLLITKKTIKNYNQEIQKIKFLKINLREKILSLSSSEKEILSLLLKKINFQENQNISPIEWLNCESLAVYLDSLQEDIFPLTGEKLFKKWCLIHHKDSKNKIKNLENQIDKISLNAKNLIYKEALRWKVNMLPDEMFDCYLKFLSVLKNDENKKYIIENKNVA